MYSKFFHHHLSTSYTYLQFEYMQQIVQLLEHMNLSQYRQVFENEQLDGDTLADCDDSVLLHELKIENKLHRIKLMKIITGKHSAINILEGKSPYVVFKSQ